MNSDCQYTDNLSLPPARAGRSDGCMCMSTSATAPSPTRPAHTAAILAVVLVSYFMIVLDNSIVFTGLPRIRAELGFSTARARLIRHLEQTLGPMCSVATVAARACAGVKIRVVGTSLLS